MMKDKKWVVITGSFRRGVRFVYGPFDSKEKAEDWIHVSDIAECEAIPLIPKRGMMKHNAKEWVTMIIFLACVVWIAFYALDVVVLKGGHL